MLFQQLETKHTKPKLYQTCNVYRKNKLPWQPTNFSGLRCFIFWAGAWIPFPTILYVKKPSHFHIFAFYSMHSWCTEICHELKARRCLNQISRRLLINYLWDYFLMGWANWDTLFLFTLTFYLIRSAFR